jgi:hypothetical protein
VLVLGRGVGLVLALRVGLGDGWAPPAQDAPLMVQLSGPVEPPLTMKPNVAVWPGASGAL